MSPLYRRLLLWFCLANLVTLLVSIAVTERLARHAYARDPDWPRIATAANEAYVDGGVRGLDHWIERTRHEGIAATLFEGERNLSAHRPPVSPRLLRRLLAAEALELYPRPGLIVATQQVSGRDGVARRLIAARLPRPPPPRLGQLLLIQVLLSLLVIGAVGWWLSRSIARPVAAIGAAAQRVAGGDLAARVAAPWTAGADEIATLARDFDRMAARIEALVTQERRVLQDVSHELRSPLARLQLALELARRDPAAAAAHFARAETEIERLDRLIGDALSLSRLESELPGTKAETIDLAALAQRRVEAARLDADARQVVLQLDAPAALELQGHAALVERALDNLLTNAIKFNRRGGRVWLRLRCTGDAVELQVRDEGPGAPEGELRDLFRPFFRGSNASRASGHGLGLALVERVARAHGGRVEARNAVEAGLIVTLTLPARP